MTITRQELVDRLDASAEQNRMIYAASTPQLLDIPTYDGSGQAVHPSVLFFPNAFSGYKYWMAFTPYPNLNSAFENPSIVASNDGVTWVVPTGLTNPVVAAPVAGFHADTSLVFDGAKLCMYYAHFGIVPTKTYRRTSTDGITWAAAEEVTHMDGADVRYLGTGRWESWNLGKNGELSRRVSVDGITFSLALRVPTNLVGRMGHVMVYNDGAGYHFLAAVAPADRSYLSNELFYGYSETGSTVFFDLNPLLKPTAGLWYSTGLYTSSMIPDGNNEFTVFVSGFAGGSVARIGKLKVKRNNMPQAIVQTGSKAHQTKRILLYAGQEIRSTDLVYSPFLGATGIIPDFNDYPNKTITITNDHDKGIKMRFLVDHYGGTLSAWKGVTTPAMQEITIPAGAGLFRRNLLDDTDLPILGKIYAGDIKIALLAADGGGLPTSGSIVMELTMWS